MENQKITFKQICRRTKMYDVYKGVKLVGSIIWYDLGSMSCWQISAVDWTRTHEAKSLEAAKMKAAELFQGVL